MDHITNPIILKNCKCPFTGNNVKRIEVMKVMKKLKTNTTNKPLRTKWDLKWQYFRDRYRMSITKFYKQNKGKQIKVIYFKDPKIYHYWLDPQKDEPTILPNIKSIRDILNNVYSEECPSEDTWKINKKGKKIQPLLGSYDPITSLTMEYLVLIHN